MPPATKMKDFVDALRTGKTKTMHSLDKLFQNAPTQTDHPLKSDPDFTDERFKKRNALDSLPAWAKTKLKDNLPPPVPDATFNLIVKHIDDWPNSQKEDMRSKLVEVINENRRVDFFWELHRGENEGIVIEDTGPGGAVTITFRSPRKKVRFEEPEVIVDV